MPAMAFPAPGPMPKPWPLKPGRNVKAGDALRFFDDRHDVRGRLDHAGPHLDNLGIRELRKHGVDVLANTSYGSRVRLGIQDSRFFKRRLAIQFPSFGHGPLVDKIAADRYAQRLAFLL